MDVCKTLVGPADVTAASGVDVAMMAVDLDGDGADETLLLPKGGTAGTLFVAHEGKTAWTVDEVKLSEPAHDIALVDLGRTSEKGEALIDIAVVTASGITVLWNDGTGTLDAAKATKIGVLGLEYRGEEGEDREGDRARSR